MDDIVYVFQFHDGSIKGPTFQVVQYPLQYFNSTMVRLKVCDQWYGLATPPVFQFHDGSIKGLDRIYLYPLTLKFQFHDGSIKGEDVVRELPDNELFQFHDGSIKGDLEVYARLFWLHFNSTMVRLKEWTTL